MKKKLLAILLAALMIMAMIPTVAFAEEAAVLEATVGKFTGYEVFPTVSGTAYVTEFGMLTYFDGDTLKYICQGETGADYWMGPTMAPLEPEDEAPNDLDGLDCYVVVYFMADKAGPGFADIENATVKLNGETVTTKADREGTSLVIDAAHYGRYCWFTSESKTSPGTTDTHSITLVIPADKLTAPTTPSNSGSANVKGKIDAADFGYELIIPAETTLTEASHTDVKLGGDGKVSVKDIKHGGGNMEISYTVDLTNGDLKDGSNHTIATTYKVQQGEASATDLVGGATPTNVTVYTGGVVKDSYVTVTADSEQWDAAPVGDYNATVVFNFDSKEAAAETKTVADIADGVIENLPNFKPYYMRYYNGNLIIVAELNGTDALVSVPGTTVVTATTYDGGPDGTLKAWTCTVDGATYLFKTYEDVVTSVDVSGLSNPDYNNLYAMFG